MKIRNLRRTTMQWMATLLAVLVFLPAVGTAQTPEERIETAMVRAEEAGIPVSLLESKRAEGRAKGVPMDRIAMAVETRLEHLEAAREAMGRGANDVDAAQLSVGADAIGAGVSEAVLRQVTASTERDQRSVATAALAYLVSQEGLASEVALARVQAALARGPQALADLTARAGAPAGRIPAGVPPVGNSTRGGPGASGPPASVPAPGQANPPAIPSRGGSSDGAGAAPGAGEPPASVPAPRQADPPTVPSGGGSPDGAGTPGTAPGPPAGTPARP